MTLDASLLADEGVAAPRIAVFLDHDLAVLAMLLVHLVVRVYRAVLLEGLRIPQVSNFCDGDMKSAQSAIR